MERMTKDEITARLNEVYATESSSLDPVLQQMSFNALSKEDWQEEYRIWRSGAARCATTPDEPDFDSTPTE